MGNYNSTSESTLPYTVQPPTTYDASYMTKLVASVNTLTTQLNAIRTASELGRITVTVAPIANAASALVGSFTANGQPSGNTVTVSSVPQMPTGVIAVGKITGTNIIPTINIEVYNLSGASVTLGSTTFTVTCP